MKGTRLDVEMVNRGIAPSREKARAFIMAGEVTVNGIKADKAGFEVKAGDSVMLLKNPIPFVSRGGLKLDKAVKAFSLCLQGKKCADIGASTGGFTDCMLQNGAEHVHSIDVGYGQLDWRLRNDPRVTVMEKTNARYIKAEDFPYLFDFASIDVCFISLDLILPALYPCLRDEGEVVALIKPQFEAERGEIGKNGVVREKEIHIRVCDRIMHSAASLGFSVQGLSFSPITGPEGNIEFLLWLKKSTSDGIVSPDAFHDTAEEVVHSAHENDFKQC